MAVDENIGRVEGTTKRLQAAEDWYADGSCTSHSEFLAPPSLRSSLGECGQEGNIDGNAGQMVMILRKAN